MLSGIPRGRLLSLEDFLEIPNVVEIIEEDGCRLPLTDERWQDVIEEIPSAVETLARTIEMDCVIEFKDAVLQTARDDLQQTWFWVARAMAQNVGGLIYNTTGWRRRRNAVLRRRVEVRRRWTRVLQWIERSEDAG